MPLSINVIKKNSGVYSVELAGAIDGETYQRFEQELKSVIGEGPKAISLDMAGIDYISSIGIKSVIWVKKALKAENATFAIVNLQPQIKKVFDVMNLLPILDIFDEMPEADKYIDQVIKEEMGI